MDDVFSLSRSSDQPDSRIVRITLAKQAVRIRSEPLWVGLHWVGESILCAVKDCEACRQGYTKRPYAMIAVDRPGNAIAVLQLTEGDLALCTRLDQESKGTIRIGSQFRVWRPQTRQPMSAEFLGFTADLLPVPRESLIVDVLRIHKIKATEGDVRTGGYRALTSMRAASAVGGTKVTA